MITRVQPFTLNQKPKKINFGNAESLLAEFMQKGKTPDLVIKFAQEIMTTRELKLGDSNRLITKGLQEQSLQWPHPDPGGSLRLAEESSTFNLSERLLQTAGEIKANLELSKEQQTQKLRRLFSIYGVK